MIYYRVVWDTDKNIGKAYNREMELLPNDNDFCCFVDRDAMFVNPFFGKQLEDIVKANKDCGCFVAMANRIGCLWQRQSGVDWNNDNMKYHSAIGIELAKNNYTNTKDVTNVPKNQVFGGVCMLVKKSVWKKVGGFKNEGILGIDNDFHWKCQDNKEKVLLMRGVYLYHWYRGGDMANKKHLE